MSHPFRAAAAVLLACVLAALPALAQEKTQKPPLHGAELARDHRQAARGNGRFDARSSAAATPSMRPAR